jgi:membrane protein implicated in regulation of membrane protease activity
MQYYAAVFFVLALIAGAFGASHLPSVANTLAWFGFSVFGGLTISALWRWRSDHRPSR